MSIDKARNSQMIQNWEDKFTRWIAPPGITEEERCSNAETAIKNAIKCSS